MTNVGYRIRNGWLQKPPLGVQLNHAHPLTKGLVGCWLFNEGGGDKAYALSGYNNHGTLENMAFPPSTTSGWNPCKNGVGLAFDGNNDYVDCGNDSSLNITDAITIEAWVKRASMGVEHDFVSKWLVEGSWQFLIESDKVWWQVAASNNTQTISTTTINSNRWYHLVGTYNRSTQKVYVNGVEEGSVFKSGNIASKSTPVIVGTNSVTDNFFFNGSIDGVKIYNRALSAEEIQQLYIEPYCIFEPATKHTIIDERLSTPHVGSNIAAMQMLR